MSKIIIVKNNLVLTASYDCDTLLKSIEANWGNFKNILRIILRLGLKFH